MNWVQDNLGVIGGHTTAHLAQSLPPIVIAFALSLPLAKLANRMGWLRSGVTTLSGLMYAIPSLPLFVLLPGLLGTGFRSPLRSEEHTSELQSRGQLVCRLLLEKKNHEPLQSVCENMWT